MAAVIVVLRPLFILLDLLMRNSTAGGAQQTGVGHTFLFCIAATPA